MRFRVEIDCDNAAFDDAEIVRILDDVKEHVPFLLRNAPRWTRTLRDVNGNCVGMAWIEESE